MEKKLKPIYTCDVCGYECIDEMSPLSNIQVYKDWFIHRIHFVGSHLDVVTCKECDMLPMDQIFEGYKKRIRAGFNKEYH